MVFYKLVRFSLLIPVCRILELKKNDKNHFVGMMQSMDIMDFRHQPSAMCIIMLVGEDTHPWSATNVGNLILATIPVDQ